MQLTLARNLLSEVLYGEHLDRYNHDDNGINSEAVDIRKVRRNLKALESLLGKPKEGEYLHGLSYRAFKFPFN